MDVAYLWVSLGLLSTALVLTVYDDDERWFVVVLFTTSFLFLSWPQLRLGTFFGSDIYGELFVAQYTFRHGLTPILMEKQRYANVLSVTVLPDVISKLTGLPIETVFATALVGAVASVPILVYVFIRRVTGCVRIAGLSSLMFIFDYAFFNVFPALMREDIALLFLILALYAAYMKQKYSKVGYIVVYLLSVLGVVVSHYTVFLFSIVMLASLYLLDALTRNSARNFLSNVVMVFGPVLGFAWLMFMSPTVLKLIVDALAFYSRVWNQLSPHPYSAYLLSSPRGGDLSSIVLDVYRILILSGSLIGLSICRRTKSRSLWIFTLQGITFFLVALPFISLPIGRSVPLDRIWTFGLLFLSFFGAIAVIQISSLTSRLLQDFMKAVRVSRFIKVAVVAFLLSLFLINHVAMSPPEYYTQQVRGNAPLRRESDNAFLKWSTDRLDSRVFILGDAVVLDQLRYSPLSLIGVKTYSYSDLEKKLHTESGVMSGEYIIVMDYTIKDNYVLERLLDVPFGSFPNSRLVQRAQGRVEIHYLAGSLAYRLDNEAGNNRIYDNDRNLLFLSVKIWTPFR